MFLPEVIKEKVILPGVHECTIASYYIKYLIVGIDKECMECGFACVHSPYNIGFSQEN